MKKIYVVGIVFLVVIVGIFYVVDNFVDSTKEEYADIYVEENSLDENEVQVDVEKIKIHIIGEVASPGIYEIDAGSRIDDAIKCAGGATENADFDKVNLAYELSDGEKIYIPSIFDDEAEYTISNDVQNSKVNINKATSSELETINGIGPSLAEKIIAYRKENGRFSSIEDLKNVSGIGEKKYESIKDSVVVK